MKQISVNNKIEIVEDEIIINSELLDPDEVLIKVEYVTLNYPDLLMTQGKYQLVPKEPFTLGSEAIGRICKSGDKAKLKGYKKGDRVLAIMWHGAFTNYLKCSTKVMEDESRAMKIVRKSPNSKTLRRMELVKIPKEFDNKIKKAAVFGFAYSAAYYALVNRALISKRPKSNRRILILGASGGLGHAAIQIGIKMKAQLIAAYRDDKERELLDERYKGKVELVTYEGIESKELNKRDGKAVDVVFDTVGGDRSLPALKSLNPGGDYLVIGFASGIFPCIELNIVLLKECQIVGCAWGSWASRNVKKNSKNMETLLKWLADESINPIIHPKIYNINEIKEAVQDMNNGNIIGKALIKM